MYLRHLLALAVFCLSATVAVAQPTSVEKLTSADGNEFYFAHLPKEERVTFDIIWQSDWLLNEKNNALAPAVGSQLMLAGGAGDLDAAELQSQFNDLVSDGSLVATPDHVRGRLVVLKNQTRDAVEIANKVLVSPTLDERWMWRIIDEIEARVEEEKTQSAYLGWDAVRRLIFGDTAVYRFTSNGGDYPVSSVTRAQILDWHKRTFVRASAMVVVAGNISEEDAKLRVDELLAGMPEGEAAKEFDAAAEYKPTTIIITNDDIEKTTLSYIAPLAPTSEGGEYEDIVATHILGGGEQSRLFQAVRQELRASYGFGTALSAYSRKNRFLLLSGEVETDKLQQARSVVKETYKMFKKQGVSEEEATALRTMFTDGIKVNLTHSSVVAYVIAESVLDGYPADRLLGLGKELELLDSNTVNKHIDQMFPKMNAFIEVIVTPEALNIEGACVVVSSADVDVCAQ